ncbi:MAG TPA: hypothetical protein VGD66_16440 [Allosphingosinicella sp.]
MLHRLTFVHRLLALLLAIAAAPASADGGAAGRWALRVGDKTLMVLEIAPDGSAPGRWKGKLSRPAHFRIDGSPQQGAQLFSGIQGPVVERSVSGAVAAAGRLLLSIAGAGPGGEDEVQLTSEGGVAELRFVGFPAPPLMLVRASAGEAVSASWDPTRTYRADWEWPSNPQMTQIFAADQAARQDWSKADRGAVARDDAARLAGTTALLRSGALRSGEDFYHAAFLFQHGEQADDYLLAHSLALIAIARGRSDATWIAAASLDRYLLKIGRKQVYGTQYQSAPGEQVTQEPFDRALVSDPLRGALGVPTLAEQEAERLRLQSQNGPK